MNHTFFSSSILFVPYFCVQHFSLSLILNSKASIHIHIQFTNYIHVHALQLSSNENSQINSYWTAMTIKKIIIYKLTKRQRKKIEKWKTQTALRVATTNKIKLACAFSVIFWDNACSAYMLIDAHSDLEFGYDFWFRVAKDF